jgi:hypothetical protein
MAIVVVVTTEKDELYVLLITINWMKIGESCEKKKSLTLIRAVSGVK